MPVLLEHGPGLAGVPLLERINRSALDDLLVVVPTKRRLRHLTRAVMNAVPGKAVPELPFHTLESLAHTVYAALPGTRPILRGPVLPLLVHTAVQSQAASLAYFRPKGDDAMLFRGTLEKIIAVINTLKESGVYPGQLEEELGNAELDERKKLHDVCVIYQAYDEALELLGATDLGGMYRTLSLGCTQQRFEETFRRLYPAVTTLALAGFDEFAGPEIGFLKKLSGLPGLSVSMLFDFLPGNSGLFGHLEENYRRFRELGFRGTARAASWSTELLTFGSASRTAGAQQAIGHIARNLLRNDGGAHVEDLSPYVTVAKADSRTREAQAICSLVKYLAVRRPERDLSAICVAMIRPERYTDIFREQFPKFGIPVNITDRYHLSRSPLVSAVMALLRMPMNGYRREEVIAAVGTPYLSFGRIGAPLDAANLASVSRRLRITAGLASWLHTLDGHAALLSRRASGGAGAGSVQAEQADVGPIRKARADIVWLGELLREIGGECTPKEFRGHLRELVEVLRVRQNLLAPAGTLSPEMIERDVRAYARFLEVVDSVAGLLEFQHGAAEAHHLRFYYDRLRIAIAQERYNVRERAGEGVLVTSIEETRGLPVEVMILAGLVDGDFPDLYQAEIFLSAARQRDREQWHSWRNRYLFYQAVTNWSEHLYLTFPAREGELELVRSPFVDSFEKIATVERWDVPADAPFGRAIWSEDDLLRWYGTDPSPLPAEMPVDHDLTQKLDDIRRAVAVERSRTESHGLPEFEGVIFDALPPEDRSGLERLKERTYSVSQLELYGRCPFRFFAQRVLQLGVPEEFREELTALEKGSILHEALFEFYTDRRDRNLPPIAGCTDAEYDQALQDLVRITGKKLAVLEIPDAFWDLEKALILGRAGKGGLLQSFLAAERARTQQSVPAYFEVGFGGAGGRPQTDRTLVRDEPIVAGGVRLRGKVDRVDIGDGFFTIIDYKTGAGVASMKDIREGWSLQLPVYLLAIESLLQMSAGRQLTPAGGLYYRLREPVEVKVGLGSGRFTSVAFDETRSQRVVKDDDALRAVIDDAMRMVRGYVDDMGKGIFRLTSPENIRRVCVTCDFRTVCRIQTFRHVRPETKEDE